MRMCAWFHGRKCNIMPHWHHQVTGMIWKQRNSKNRRDTRRGFSVIFGTHKDKQRLRMRLLLRSNNKQWSTRVHTKKRAVPGFFFFFCQSLEPPALTAPNPSSAWNMEHRKRDFLGFSGSYVLEFTLWLGFRQDRRENKLTLWLLVSSKPGFF